MPAEASARRHTILVIEDAAGTARLMEVALEEEGYGVTVCGDGGSGREAALGGGFDVIVIDRRLPVCPGIEIVEALRENRDWTPILMVSGAAGITDRVESLRAGVDDYLVKPFALEEFVARVRALLRRRMVERGAGSQQQRGEIRVGSLVMDLDGREVERDGVRIELTPTEFALLRVFMEQPGRALSRRHLHDEVWDAGEDGSNVVDVYVGYLRRKIDAPFATDTLETVRGVGYRLRAPNDDQTLEGANTDG